LKPLNSGGSAAGHLEARVRPGYRHRVVERRSRHEPDTLDLDAAREQTALDRCGEPFAARSNVAAERHAPAVLAANERAERAADRLGGRIGQLGRVEAADVVLAKDVAGNQASPPRLGGHR
jgi:hypothetical protein